MITPTALAIAGLTPKVLANFMITPQALAISGLTPKALANFSPAVGAQRQPWDTEQNSRRNPERVSTAHA